MMFGTQIKRASASSAKWQGLQMFLVVTLLAICLVMIGIHKAIEFGLIGASIDTTLSAFAITFCVSISVGVLAWQHDVDMKALRDRLENAGPVDQITGVLDRHIFEMILRDEHGRMARTGRPSAIAMFEIDHLGDLAERYGEGFCNAAFRQVAQLVNAQLRGPFDKISRWEGSIFIMLLNDVSISQAEQICERLRMTFGEELIYHKGHSAYIAVSFGVSSFSPGAETETVLNHAQAGLEKSQRFGGNKVCSTTQMI